MLFVLTSGLAFVLMLTNTDFSLESIITISLLFGSHMHIMDYIYKMMKLLEKDNE